ncbi:MAG TPA: ribonuclease P protein component 1 [archaeon]|nr:ribonuclease P protein component 1 [archaeon]
MRTARNILRHELIGLDCIVMKASNKSSTGISGRIVDETMKTVVIKDTDMKRVQKSGSTFRLSLSGKKVDVNGRYLLARPEDRIKKKFNKW